jgi:hypothetical protein
VGEGSLEKKIKNDDPTRMASIIVTQVSDFGMLKFKDFKRIYEKLVAREIYKNQIFHTLFPQISN